MQKDTQNMLINIDDTQNTHTLQYGDSIFWRKHVIIFIFIITFAPYLAEYKQLYNNVICLLFYLLPFW